MDCRHFKFPFIYFVVAGVRWQIKEVQFSSNWSNYSLFIMYYAQDMYGWPDEPFEEMDSTLAVQQVMEYHRSIRELKLSKGPNFLCH